MTSRAEVFFWIGRELVWWWLVAGLAAIMLSYLRRLPLARDVFAQSHRVLPPSPASTARMIRR